MDALVAGGLFHEHRQGRRRHVSLLSSAVAETLERLASLALPLMREPNSLAQSSRSRESPMRERATTTDAMAKGGHLDRRHGLTLTASGSQWFDDVGITWRPAPATSDTRLP